MYGKPDIQHVSSGERIKREKRENDRFACANAQNGSRVFCAFIIGVSLQLHLASSTHTYRHTHSLVHSFPHSHTHKQAHTFSYGTPKINVLKRKGMGFRFSLDFRFLLLPTKVFLLLLPIKSGGSFDSSALPY